MTRHGRLGTFKQMRLALAMVRNPEAVEFLGECDCGCGHWKIRFRDSVTVTGEARYDRLRYMLKAVI